MSHHAHMAPFMQHAGPMHPHHGAPHMPHQHHHAAHGFCGSCCHPVAQCVCHRECRKIEKELLVQPTTAAGKTDTPAGTSDSASHGLTTEEARIKISAMMDLTSPVTPFDSDEKDKDSQVLLGNIQRLRQMVSRQLVVAGMGSAVIGGGCCVHLSIEYMPVSPLVDTPAFSGAMVIDSQSTVMLWGKYFTGDGYHVKECVITTNPGAYLWVASINSVTRVRWCEIISC